MKIVILAYNFLSNIGGAEIIIGELASRLSKEGNNVSIISNFRDPVGMSADYRVYKTPRLPSEIASRMAHILVAPFILFFIHISGEVDIVQVSGLMDLFASFPVKTIFRFPVVLRLSKWQDPYLFKKLKRGIYLMLDTIIALNSYMKAKLIEGGFNKNKIVVINNGVDINTFRPNSFNKNKLIVLWVGRLDSNKDPKLAIETILLLKDAYKDICLQIVGQGYMEKQLRELVYRYELYDFVNFLGYKNHNNVAEIMRNSLIYLFTSKGEGMSNSLLEAMACGLAVVATSTSSYCVIQNGVNGFIANDSKNMALTISRLIEEPLLRYKVGENARRTVIEKFSTNRMYSRYLQLYKNLTARRRRASLAIPI